MLLTFLVYFGGLVLATIAAATVFGPWGPHRLQRNVTHWAKRTGLQLLECHRRMILRGPFFWTFGRPVVIFRVTVAKLDRSAATGWICCPVWLERWSQIQMRWDAVAQGFPVIFAGHKKEDDMHAATELTITPATVADVPLILDLIRGIAEYEKLSHEVIATEELLREHLFSSRPAAEVLIARLGARPVGFALYFQNFSTFLGKPGIYLEDLFVLPDCRGKGIGKALLTQVARVAAARKCGRLEWSVLDWNEPAIKFYESLGAKPMSEWTVYRMTEDAIEKLARQ